MVGNIFGQRIHLLGIVLIAFLAAAPSAFADFETEIAKDLAVKSAYFVAPVGDEWLIDVDTKQGIQTGDLFTVVRRGDPIIHPVTQEVLGNIDEVVGVVQVTQIKSGYSYATILTSAKSFQPGQSIKRFDGLPAFFWDYTGKGEAVFAEVQSALPHLNWQNYRQALTASAQDLAMAEPGLVFVLKEQGLGVTDHKLQPLRFYRSDELGMAFESTSDRPAAPSVSAPAAPQPASPAIVAAPEPPSAPSPQTTDKKIKLGQQQGSGLITNQASDREGIWFGPNMSGHPVGVEIGDLTADGKNEVALLFTDRLVVARVEQGQFNQLAEKRFGRALKALTLDGLDLDRDNRMELYVTATRDGQLHSQLLEMQNGTLHTAVEHIPWFLRKVHFVQEGPVLLGQAPNEDSTTELTDFSGEVFRVIRDGSGLNKGERVNLPEGVALHGFTPYVHEGQSLLVNIDINDKLTLLTPDGALLWESNDHFGGSETYLVRGDTTADGRRNVYLKPRLSPGPNSTILAPVNEGSRVASTFRQFRSSHLRALSYDGYAMVEQWRTKPQGGYMADFRLADADNDGSSEIAMLVMYSHGSWFKAQYGKTALVVYEIE